MFYMLLVFRYILAERDFHCVRCPKVKFLWYFYISWLLASVLKLARLKTTTTKKRITFPKGRKCNCLRPWTTFQKTNVCSWTNISGQCKRDGNICSNMTSLAECSQSLSHSSSQQQITSFQSMKPTPTDCSCVHITLISQSIHNGAKRLYDNHFEQFETRMVFVLYSTVIKYFHKVTYTCHI